MCTSTTRGKTVHQDAKYAILVYTVGVGCPPVATILSCEASRVEACKAAQQIAAAKPYHIVKLLDMVHLTAQRIQ